MSQPQQPGNWSDPSWPSQQPQYADPVSPYAADPSQPYASSAPPYSDPSQAYANPAQPYSDPYANAAAYQAGYPGYAPPAASTQQNGLAIASMIVSIAGAALLVCYGVGALAGVVGAILGHVARKQVRERGESGDGMALAGIIVGWITAGLGLIGVAVVIAFFVWAANQDPSSFDNSTYNMIQTLLAATPGA